MAEALVCFAIHQIRRKYHVLVGERAALFWEGAEPALSSHGRCKRRTVRERTDGERYCLAHHLWVQDGQRTLMVMSIRYLDTFIRVGGRWFFADRQLIVNWTDPRPSLA
jgi:hypothetical protein